MRFRQTFALITLVATLQADTISFGQLNGSTSGFYNRMLLYISSFGKPSQEKADTRQKNTIQKEGILIDAQKNLNRYLDKIKAPKPKILPSLPKKILPSFSRSDEIMAQLQSKEVLKTPTASDVWQLIQNIINPLINSLENTLNDAQKFAHNATQAKFFLVNVPEIFFTNYPNAQGEYQNQISLLRKQLDDTNNEMLKKQWEPESFLYQRGEQLDDVLKKKFTLNNITSALLKCEEFVENIKIVCTATQEESVDHTIKKDVLQFIDNVFARLFSEHTITTPKNTDEYCFLSIKKSLYQYLWKSLQSYNDIFNTEELEKKSKKIQSLMSDALQQYKLTIQSNKKQTTNFDTKVLESWNKIFTKIQYQTSHLNVFIAKNLLDLPTFYEKNLQVFLSNLLTQLQEKRLALITKAKNFFSINGKPLSHDFINDYLTQLNNYQQTADLYISLMQTEQNQSALLTELQTFIAFCLGQQATIKATLPKQISTQGLYNYLIIQSTAQYTSATMRTIIRLYGYYGNTNNEQLKTIQDYVSKLESYAKERALDSNK